MLQIRQWTSNSMLMVVPLHNQATINNHQVRGGYTNSKPSTSWPPVISMNSNALGPAWPIRLKNTNIRHIGIFGLDVPLYPLRLCQRFGHVTQMQRGLEIQLRHPDSHCNRQGLRFWFNLFENCGTNITCSWYSSKRNNAKIQSPDNPTNNPRLL